MNCSRDEDLLALRGEQLVEREEVLVEHQPGPAERVLGVEVEDVADAVEDERVDLALAGGAGLGVGGGHQAALLASAVGLELLERHGQLRAGRLREPVRRPGGLPDDLDVDGLDAVERAQRLRDRGRHVRHERAPARGRDQVDLDVARRCGGRPPPRPCRRSRPRGPGSRGHRRRAGRRSGARGPSTLSSRRRRSESRWWRWRAPGRRAARARRAGRARCRGSSRRARRPSRPRRVGHPLPDVAGELLGAARRRAVGCVRTGTVQPQPASAQLQRSGSNVWPHGHGRSSSPRAAASHSAPVGSRAAEPRAERGGVGARDEHDGMVGELRVGDARVVGPEARERGVGHREAPDQHARRRARRRRPPAARATAARAARRRERRSGTRGREAEPGRHLLTRRAPRPERYIRTLRSRRPGLLPAARGSPARACGSASARGACRSRRRRGSDR